MFEFHVLQDTPFPALHRCYNSMSRSQLPHLPIYCRPFVGANHVTPICNDRLGAHFPPDAKVMADAKGFEDVGFASVFLIS